MKITQTTLLLFLLISASAPLAKSADFDSGSNGSYGAMNITANTTLDLPADGKFHCTTISVAQGAILTFKRNALSTPVYLLAQGDVTINGTIDVSGGNAIYGDPKGGLGGPGGFDGGRAGNASDVGAGSGYGPGAGKRGDNTGGVTNAGSGSYASKSQNDSIKNHGETYGSPLLVPLVGGSGGGGIVIPISQGPVGGGGGGGGGAILIASRTRIVFGDTGSVYANGGYGTKFGFSGYFNNHGSGGAIRLVAPNITGRGSLKADPFVPSFTNLRYAGSGRIRVDSLDRDDVKLTFSPYSVSTVGSAMFVFPNKIPRLDIVEAAGNAIAEGTSSAVQFLLPLASPTTQTVKVQARDFSALVKINVVLTPEFGDPIVYPAQIDNKANNPAVVEVPVVVPVNTVVTINAWTRKD